MVSETCQPGKNYHTSGNQSVSSIQSIVRSLKENNRISILKYYFTNKKIEQKKTEMFCPSCHRSAVIEQG